MTPDQGNTPPSKSTARSQDGGAVGLASINPQNIDLRPLIDALPDPVLLVDSRQRVLIMNQAASRLLGVRSQQAEGMALASVVTDRALLDLLDGSASAFSGMFTSQDAATIVSTGSAFPSKSESSKPMEEDDLPHPVVQRELRVQRGSQHLTYQAMVTRNSEGANLIVLRDITTLAQAMQMKTDFVANAGHELRTPLAAIKVAFETLRDVFEEDPQQTRRCVSVIDGHLRRLEEMLRDLLDLSRVENPLIDTVLRTVVVEELFAVTRATLGPLAKQKQLELAFETDNTQSEYATDHRLLNLVIKNLVENAIKYTPAGGKVTVGVFADGAGGFRMSVTDTGIGIPAEHLERVFERFYQVDASRSGSGRGTGLGLAIVKHAVHALGGTVRLTSEQGKGTQVVCHFPPETHTGRQALQLKLNQIRQS